MGAHGLKVGELYALFTLDSSGVNTALEGISTKLTSIGNEFIRAGTLWSNAITVPIKNALGDALETGMEFSKEMAKATTKAGIDVNTEEGMAAYQALREEAFRVAKQSVYTAEEVAGAYDKMAMAGWEYQSMLGGLEPIMDLAAASGEGVVGVSDIVTDAMTAFGLTFEHAGKDVQAFNKDVQHFSDVLAAAATSSNTDIGMMGESFKYAGNMAGSFSYSIDDVAIALGLMANRGVKASQAGTSLRALWKNLLAPSDKVQSAIDAVGLSLHDGEGNMLTFMELMQQMREKFNSIGMDMETRNTAMDLLDQFYDKDAVQNYVDALIELEKQYGNTAEEHMNPYVLEKYREAVNELTASFEALMVETDVIPEELNILKYATEIGGVRGMSALLAIINASEEEFQGLTDAVYGSEGRTHEMKESMLDNAMGDLEMFKSSVDILKVSIEELVDDQLRSLLQTATEIIDKFISMDDETKMTILKMAGLAAAIGPALVGFGTLLKILPALGTAFSFITTPLGLVTVLLGGLAMAAMDSDGKISKAFADMKEAFGLDGLDFDIQSILEGIDVEQMLDGLLGSVTELANSEQVQAFMGRLGEGMIGALGALGDIVGSIISYIFSPEGLSRIWDTGVAVGKYLLEGLGYAFAGINKFLTNMTNKILEDLGIIDGEAIKEELAAGAVLNEAITESVTDEAGEIVYNARDAITAILYDIASGGYGYDLIEALGEQAQDAWSKIGNRIIEAKSFTGTITQDTLKGLFGEIFGDEAAFKDLSDEFWTNAINAINGDTTTGDPKEFFEYLLGSMYAETLAAQAGEDAADAATEAAKAEAEKAFNEAVNIPVSEVVVPEFVEKTANASKEATDAMASTLAAEKDTVAYEAQLLTDEVVQEFLLTMSAENGASIGLNFSLGIAAGIKDGESDVIAAARAVADAAVSAATGTLDINSPSKVAEDEVGLMYGKGLALGILDSMPTVISASERLADVLNSQMYLGAGRSDGFAPGLRQPAYAGGYGSSTVNSPTYVHNHYMNIEHYYQKSAEDVDYLADQILVRNRRDQSGRGM